MENGRAGNEELLVAGSNERYRKIYGGMQFVSENEK